ncbi:MAG TPA: hypothetical protein VHD35_02280, partial [Chitinophagaceae bacterium]|nr:hypothetical protein [Chitinophagaceae bacterium]
DDSTYSKLILKDLEKVKFVPVLIWSQHIDDYNATKENGEISYPLNLIYELSKLDEGKKKVSQILKEWVENNLAAKISEIYRRSIHGNLERAFFELNAIPNSHLAIVLKTVVGNEQNIDWTSDLILNLIHRFLLVDTQFVDDLGNLLRGIATPNANQIGEVDKRSLINKILYFQSKSDFIRNGDIIRIKSVDNKINILATIVTPDCDLVQGTTRFLEMVELRSINDEDIKLKDQHKENIRKYNHPSFHYFPSVKIDGDFFDLIAVLKSKIIVEETADFTEIKYPAASKRLLYSHRFLFHHIEVQLELICGKSNPYKSDFLQKLLANNSRVGIPDIKNLFN